MRACQARYGGGGISSGGRLTVDRSIVRNDYVYLVGYTDAASGGGIYQHGGTLVLNKESPHVVFPSETGTRRLAPLPQAWEPLSLDELAQYCRAAETV